MSCDRVSAEAPWPTRPNRQAARLSMFQADNTTGEFGRYRWSVNSSASYTPGKRSVAAARIV